MSRASEMPPGTIVTEGALVVRRRPYATGGLPWKSRLGARYDHDEVQLLISNGASVTFCVTCARGHLCLSHDQAHTAPNSEKRS